MTTNLLIFFAIPLAIIVFSIALQKILKAYISEELLPWQKRFPDIYYKELNSHLTYQYQPY